MAKAFDKEVLRSITRSWGRFIALFGIVALGVGFYAGLRMTAPDMNRAADKFYDDTHLMDLRVVSTLGMTAEDMDALRAIEGVDQVMPAYETDAMGELGGESYVFRIHSLAAAAVQSETLPDGAVASPADDYLNRLVLQEGRWPQEPGECAVLGDVIMNTPVELGDTITLDRNGTDLDGVLDCTEYTIVGLVRSPAYVGTAALGTTSIGSGSVDQAVFVPEDAFSGDYPFSEAFITVKGAADLPAPGPDYDAAVDAVEDRIAAIAGEREQVRLEGLRAEAQQQLDEARADYEQQRNDAQQQLDEAQAQLDSARREADEGRRRLQDGQRSYDEGRESLDAQTAKADRALEQAQRTLDAKQKELAAGREQLTAETAALDSQEAQLKQQKAQLDQAIAALDAALAAAPPAQQAPLKAQRDQLASKRTEVEKGLAAVAKGRGQAAQAEATLAAGEKALAEGRATLKEQRAQAAQALESGQRQLDGAATALQTAREQLAEGDRQLADGQAQYDSRKAEADRGFAEAEDELARAQADIDALERPEWLILDRTKNYGAEGFRQDAERVDHIAAVFPFIFFLVAALVALTTMTRMVDEERMLIGTCKALGYGRGRIIGKYLVYAGAASVAGSVVGIAALAFTLPAVIMSAYSIIYVVPTAALALDWPIALLAAGLGVGITLVATAAAAGSTLRETPAALMLPPAPKPGKRILLERVGPLWGRLSFLWKVTMRNIFRYKKRFLMTVVGIAGCTALLLTGFGLQDSINDIIDKHFGPVVGYTVAVTQDDDASADDAEALQAAFADQGRASDTARVMRDSLLLVGGRSGAGAGAAADGSGTGSGADDGPQLEATLIVPQDTEAFGRLWSLHNRQSAQALPLEGDGVVLTEKAATTYGLAPGDTVLLSRKDSMGNAQGEPLAAVVSGVAENYVGNYVFAESAVYEQLFGEAPAFATVLGSIPGDPAVRERFSQAAGAIDSVKTIEYNDETIDTYRTSLRSVNLVVVVLIVAAAALAFIVLYNLTNINITERIREIATLKVLGFTRGEVKRYIFREVIILTVVGALLGLVLGVFLENFVVVTAEVDKVMFGRDIHGASFLWAFLLTLAFTLLVMLAMGRKLRSISMVESLKSNE